jgi:hypothetical protein
MIWQATFLMWIMKYTNISLLDSSHLIPSPMNDIVSSTQLCHILHGFRFKYCCDMHTNYKTSNSFQHAGSSYAFITIDAIWKVESFAVSLTSKDIELDVNINQDSIDVCEGLVFDISTFNEDGLGDLFTFGMSMPIHMVQYQDSFSWSKYSHCLFSIDPSRTILEMNNVHELFYQNMTEFLQTDIDGSLDFLLNEITVESLEKYLKTFYMPPLDIDQIFSIWDQLLPNIKTIDTVTEEVWEFASKATIIPFSIFTSMFHQRFKEYRFLESTLELLQQFYL